MRDCEWIGHLSALSYFLRLRRTVVAEKGTTVSLIHLLQAYSFLYYFPISPGDHQLKNKPGSSSGGEQCPTKKFRKSTKLMINPYDHCADPNNNDGRNWA
ncbi:hypothetical protein VitviT2T_013104 [Vitis vinifera]|uniref:Uncharacterized protein n=2 Tax=Vitis vinifera TaxID=29760 RepID=A0ABY9CFN0_VITVI|nr:hypothetical protein VitviT2T_013104 [Vitis vinifera]